MIGRVLSPSQATAATAKGHAVVTAAAGSGKTRMLVEHVLEHIFEDGIDLGQIVAITFTNRAAAEMRHRLRQRLQEIASSDTDNNLRDRARECLRTFHLAHVKTIHAFAMEILQAYPFDAALDPDFAIADEILHHQARFDVVDAMLQEIPNDSTRERSPVLELLLQWGHWRAADALQSLLARDQIDPRRVEEIANSSEEREFNRVLEWWQKHALGLIESVVGDTDLIAQMQSLVAMVTTASGPLKPEMAALPESVRTLLDASADVAKRGGAFAQVYPVFLTKDDEPRARPHHSVHGKKAELGDALWKALGDSLSTIGAKLAPVKAEWIDWSEKHERRAATIGVALMRLLRDVQQALQDRKDAESWLDFTDQLRMATELVETQPDRVASSLARRFRALLIDELQDTDPLQWRLVEALLRAETSDALRVMLVGDPRQSIYRFRGAEVALFNEATKRLVEAPSIEPTADVALDENYRTTPPLISAINGVVTDLIARITAKTAAPMHPNPMIAKVDEKIWPRGFHLIPIPKDDGDAAIRAEAEAVAASINALVHRPEAWRCEVWNGEDAPEFQPRFGDVAILLRQMTHLDAFEHALRMADIPFHVGGGAGLASRQEIMDLAHLLRVITAPTDDHALVGLLRTPWMGWSDDLLMKVTILTCGFAPKIATPLWERLIGVERIEKESVTLSDTEWAQIERTRSILARAMAESHHRSPADVAEQVLTDTGAWALIRMESEGARRLANLRRGLERIREVAPGEGFDSVHAAAQMLSRLVTRGARVDEESTIGPGENAVRILTVHGAKGLEFPIVFLPQMHVVTRGQEKRGNWAWDNGLGLGVKAQSPDENWEFKPNATMQMINRREEREVEAERARLLYVAMTRAQRMLVVSGKVNDALDVASRSAEKDSALDWIFDAMQIAPGDLNKPEIAPSWSNGAPIPVLSAERCLSLAGEKISPSIEPITALPINVSVLRRIEPLEKKLDSERSLSITSLGVREFEHASVRMWERKENTDSARIGDLFHALAEQRIGNPDLNPRAVLEEIADQSDEPLFSDVFDLWNRFEAMPLGRDIDRLENAEAELNVTIATDAGPLDGRIDLLAKRNGQWEVIDYKTTSTGGSDDDLRRRHRIQMLCYLLFLAAHAPEQGELTARIVFPALEREVTLSVDRSELENASGEITALARQVKLDVE